MKRGRSGKQPLHMEKKNARVLPDATILQPIQMARGEFQWPDIDVRESSIAGAGKGVFAKHRLFVGTMIPIVGKPLTEEQARVRQERNGERKERERRERRERERERESETERRKKERATKRETERREREKKTREREETERRERDKERERGERGNAFRPPTYMRYVLLDR